MTGKPTFGAEVQSYLTGKIVRDKRTGKQVKATQKRLAQEFPMRAETLSRKLKDSQRLTDTDVHLIGEILIWWGLITYRVQLQHLFEHVGYTLPDEDWRRKPWDSLIDDTQSSKGAVLPLQHANSENWKDEPPVERQVPSETPEICILPFQQNRFFTGRETQIAQLDHFLKESDTQPVSICGLGGVGKTQLALEYAHRRHAEEIYQAVLWVDAEDKTVLETGYISLALKLGLTERDPDKCIQAVKTWLEVHTGWLFILDNVGDLELVRSFLPVKYRDGRILFTTRSQAVGNSARRIEIEAMESADGLLFLLKCAGIVQNKADLATITTDVRDTAIELVALLGGLPLALDQAGAYIEETGVLLADYIQLYQEKRRTLLNRRGNAHGEHKESVVTTVELSLEKACKQQPLATDVLRFCAFLQPDTIPEEVLRHADAFKLDATAFNEIIAALRSYSLIKSNAEEKLFSMHRLVQDVLIDSMSPDIRKQWRERVLQVLNEALNNTLAEYPLELYSLKSHTLHLERTIVQLIFRGHMHPYEVRQSIKPGALIVHNMFLHDFQTLKNAVRISYNLMLLYFGLDECEDAEEVFYQRALSIFEEHPGYAQRSPAGDFERMEKFIFGPTD